MTVRLGRKQQGKGELLGKQINRGHKVKPHFFQGKFRGSNKGGKKVAFLFFPWRPVSACMCGRTRNGDDDDGDGGDGDGDC